MAEPSNEVTVNRRPTFQYNLITSNGEKADQDLGDAVNELLDEGWRPAGGIAMCVDPNCPKGTGLVYAQALIRLIPEQEPSDEPDHATGDANAPAADAQVLVSQGGAGSEDSGSGPYSKPVYPVL